MNIQLRKVTNLWTSIVKFMVFQSKFYCCMKYIVFDSLWFMQEKYDWRKVLVALALQWKHKKNCVVTKCRRSCCRNIVFEQLFSFVVPPLRIEGQKHACYIKISTLLYSCVFMETKMFWICIKSLFWYPNILMNNFRTGLW